MPHGSEDKRLRFYGVREAVNRMSSSAVSGCGKVRIGGPNDNADHDRPIISMVACASRLCGSASPKHDVEMVGHWEPESWHANLAPLRRVSCHHWSKVWNGGA